MLLTVIAVATLLVAVVGATFAYFSLSITGNATSTTASVTTGGVATITLNQGDTDLKLNLTAQDMAKGTANVQYYAVNSTDESSNTKETGGIWVKDTAKVYSVANVTVSGGSENDTYTCKYTVKVTPDGFDSLDFTKELPNESEAKTAAENDVVLHLVGPALDTSGTKDIKLSELMSGSIDPIEGTFTLKGDGTDAANAKVEASLYVLNDKDRSQNYLAGQTSLSVTISVESTEACTVVSAAGAGA